MAANLTPSKKSNGSRYGDDAADCVVCAPLVFTVPEPYLVAERSESPGAAKTESLTSSSDAQLRLPARSWEESLRFAGKEFEGMELQVAANGGSQGKELKVILYNRSTKWIMIKKWKGECEHEILIRDQKGHMVEQTDEGVKFFQNAQSLETSWMQPKSEKSASIPIGKLFRINDPGEYTVLVSLPIVGTVDAMLTARPLELRTDRMPPERRR